VTPPASSGPDDDTWPPTPRRPAPQATEHLGATEPEAPAPPGHEPAAAGPGAPPAPRRSRTRRRRRRWVIVAIAAALVLPVVVAGGWFLWQLSPPGSPGAPVRVVIQPGWGAREAGDALEQHDVIGSSLAFQLWAKLSGGATFQAGTYRLPTHLGVRDALDRLEAGPDVSVADDFKLLLPPGLRIDQIAARVGALPGHTAAGFLAVVNSGTVRSKYQPADQPSLEGLTWPDTYFIAKGQTDTDILRLIVNAFDAHGDAVGLGNALATTGGTLTPYEAVVSASLIQAEAEAADAADVSAVIVNRLRQGMPLQIDATLCYAKGGCPPVPSNADKAIASPYNTYKVNGLPPTPIMTVTEPALVAALHPANVPYLFYVTGKDGVTRFAATPAEQAQNIARYGVRGE
jgi:UPF0755 protein